MTTAGAGNNDRAQIAARVRGKAAEQRVSWKALAADTKINYSSLVRRMRGEVDFTATELVQVAEALDVDLGVLLPPREREAVAS